MKKSGPIFIFLLLFFSTKLFALTSEKIGRVYKVRGNVTIRPSSGVEFFTLQQDDNVFEGNIIHASRDGFVAIKFNDGSKLFLAANSKLAIERNKLNSVGIFSLIEGNLRAQVNSRIKFDDSYKMIILTPSSISGVSGTDFHVVYNPKNRVSALLVYKGKVTINTITQRDNKLHYKYLNEMLLRDGAMEATDGEYVGLDFKTGRLNSPALISPAQLDTMKRNIDLISYAGKTSKKYTKKISDGIQIILKKTLLSNKTHDRSPFPPGINTRSFVNRSDVLEKMLKNVLSKRVIRKYKRVTKSKNPPEGFYYKEINQFAPPSGGYLDLKTALYIPPPPGSSYDFNTHVYIPPINYGFFHPKSGEYLPPKGYKLDEFGRYIMISGEGETIPQKSIIGKEQYGKKNFNLFSSVDGSKIIYKASVEKELSLLIEEEEEDAEEEFSNQPLPLAPYSTPVIFRVYLSL